MSNPMGAQVEDLAGLVAELYGRQPENRLEPRLEATRRALDLLGDPQKMFKVIHLTGTNGKSSTARMIASVLREYGLRVGLFTSPHLVKFTERIEIDGHPIADERAVQLWNEIAPYIQLVDDELVAAGQARLTFFEALTVLAFAAFADAPVDVVSLEVGMGGEWDSTNVADGEVAVFTPIGLDHMDRLGSTIAEIAETKSGIIKPHAHVVTSAQVPEALHEIESRAAELGADVRLAGRDFAVVKTQAGVGGQLITVKGLAAEYRDLALPLLGEYQAENAATAIAALESFLGGGDKPLQDGVLREGLAKTTSPGRLQVVATDPTVIVDAAHNPHGAHALAEGMRENFAFPVLIGVVGILHEKDAKGILTELEQVLDKVVITESGSPRAIDPDALAATAVQLFGSDRVTVADDLESAMDEARYLAAQKDGSGILVTGSITLIGDLLAKMADDTADESES